MKDLITKSNTRDSFNRIKEIAKENILRNLKKSKHSHKALRNGFATDQEKVYFDLCLGLWDLMLNQDLQGDLEKYRSSLYSFMENHALLGLSYRSRDNRIIQYYFKFFMESLLLCLNPIKSDYTKQDLCMVISVLNRFQSYAIRHLDYQFVKVGLMALREIECKFTIDLEKEEMNKICKVELHKIQSESVVCFFQTFLDRFDESKYSKIDFDLFYNQMIGKDNFLQYFDKLCCIILLYESLFKNAPVYVDSKDIVYFNLIQINWNKFLLCVQKFIPLNVLESNSLYLKLNDKIEALKKHINNKYKDYEERLLKELDARKPNHQAFVHFKLSSLKVGILNQTLMYLHNIIGKLKADQDKELNRYKQELSEHQRQIKENTKQYHELCEAHESLLQSFGELDNTSYDFLKENEKKCEILKRKHEKIQLEFDTINQSLDRDIDSLTKQIVKLRKKKVRYFNGLNENDKKINSLRTQVSGKKDHLRQLKVDLNELTSTFSDLQIEEKDCQYQYDLLMNKKKQCEIDVKNLKNEQRIQEDRLNTKIASQKENAQIQERQLKSTLHNLLDTKKSKLDQNSLILKTHAQLLSDCQQITSTLKKETYQLQLKETELNQMIHKRGIFDTFFKRTAKPTQTTEEYLSRIHSNCSIKLTDFERGILKEIKDKAPTEITCFIYGGLVRDRVIGQPNADLDIVVFLPNYLVDHVCRGYHRNPFVLNLYQKRVIHPDTKTQMTIDINIYPQNSLITFVNQPALKVNALLADDQGVIYDPHNGLAELMNGRNSLYLTMIGNEAQRIQEDPIRIVRLIATSEKIRRPLSQKAVLACFANAFKINELTLGKYLSALDKLFKHYAGQQVLSNLFLNIQYLLYPMFPFLKVVPAQQLHTYLPFLKFNLNKINTHTYEHQIKSPHLSNAYLALLLLPVLAQKPASVDDVISHFFNSYKGSTPNGHLVQGLAQNLKHYLEVFNQDLYQQLSSKPRHSPQHRTPLRKG